MSIQVGLVGHGYAAQTFHWPLLSALPEYEVCAVMSSRSPADLPSVAVYESIDELLAHPGLSLVVVTAPNDLHFALGQKILQAGKHLVLEKPMTITLAEAQSLMQLAREQQCLLTVFHNRRWDGDFLTVQKILSEQLLGDVKYFESRFDRFRPNVRDRWRENAGAGAGIWFDLGPHLVDQALLLFGWPDAVSARLGALREHSKNTDYFHVQLHYPGLEVVLHASPFCAAPTERFRVEGTRGSYHKAGLDPQESQLKDGLAPNHPDFGLAPADAGTHYDGQQAHRLRTERGCYTAFYQQLANAIARGGPLPVTAAQACAVMAILTLAEQSQARQASVPSGANPLAEKLVTRHASRDDTNG